jgi:D-alanyl-lipoteichoic acid acyltransferase DltB (MBOAT superfamily)
VTFNSLIFLVFLAIFFPLYFATRGTLRIWVCLIASYIFYGWWDYRFLALIGASTLMDYAIGLLMQRTNDPVKRRLLIIVTVVVNLSFLGFFKYFNFFIDSFHAMSDAIGLGFSPSTLNITLPIGISFYTFMSMSYTIDVYRRELVAERSLLKFATFIAFFPHLVAGPILRARDLLPQLHGYHKIHRPRVIIGLGLILLGYFKKVVIADGSALVVDKIFSEPAVHSSLGLVVGVVLYAFQIYCDFAGYSDIAIGLALIMGVDFIANFRTPYISKSFSEFWNRWHISLSTWLRDYLYIPLGGNRYGTFNTYRNLMLTMLLGGLWHGADWKFVIWGALHGFYLVLQRLIGKRWDRLRKALRIPNAINNVVLIAVVFSLTCLAWIFFRANSTADEFYIIQRILSFEDFHPASIRNKVLVAKVAVLIFILLVIEAADRRFDMESLLLKSPAFRVAAFATLLWLIALFGTFGSTTFIYFQF